MKNACFVINCPVVIFTYSLSRLDGSDLAVVPKEVLNTSEVDSVPNSPLPSLEEMVPKQFAKVWAELDAYLRSMPGVEVYNTRIDIRASSRKVFARVLFQSRCLILRLLLDRGKINDPRLTFDRREDSNFANVRIGPSDTIDDQIKKWISLSRNYVDEGGSYSALHQ